MFGKVLDDLKTRKLVGTKPNPNPQAKNYVFVPNHDPTGL
jgi:hypothetical protein